MLWSIVADLAAKRRLPERSVGPLCEAAYGRKVRRASYIANAEVTYGEVVANLTASRDLKNLVTAGLLDPIGDKRGRYYVATEELKNAWEFVRGAIQPNRTDDDPFSLVQLRLDLAV